MIKQNSKKMKHIKALLILFFILSCGSKDKTENKESISNLTESTELKFQDIDLHSIYLESMQTFKERKKNNVISSPPVFFDTTINNIQIQTLLRDTNEIIIRGDTTKSNFIKYLVDELILNLAFNNKIIHNRKLIQKTDFNEYILEADLPKYTITNYRFIESNPKETVFNLMICQPDTDICFDFRHILNYDGTIDIIDLDE